MLSARRVFMLSMIVIFLTRAYILYAANQTSTLSPIHPGSELPFRLEIEREALMLPMGVHSGALGVCENKWLFLAGRTNGLHNFDDNSDNFPPKRQNTDLIVVDIANMSVFYRSLHDPESGLSARQIDLLSVTSPQYYQRDNTLYMSGGYGVDSATGKFSTKDALTALDISGLISWVVDRKSGDSVSAHIRQIFDPIFQITGGAMNQAGDGPTLLIFGQNFEGFYNAGSNGIYSKQVRRFHIIDDGTYLGIQKLLPEPAEKKEIYRRRDLNIVPSIYSHLGEHIPYFLSLSGVFTPEGGAWTIPVDTNSDGVSWSFAPGGASSFKQGMNNYACANMSLFSRGSKNMFITLLGGISYGYFNNNFFETNNSLPFINQVTTIKRDAYQRFSQYIMDSQYPIILSSGPNAGNSLLFGAGAFFIKNNCIKIFNNQVIDFDSLLPSQIIGYIAGGIQSTLPNTVDPASDTAASPYIFRVRLTKNFTE